MTATFAVPIVQDSLVEGDEYLSLSLNSPTDGYGIDPGLGTATLTIHDDDAGTPPVAADDAYSVHAGRSLLMMAPGVLGNDSSAVSATLSASQVSGPSHGYLMLSPDGSFTYSPNPGFAGDDAFTYQAGNGAAHSNAATVTIHVTNAAPVANGDSSSARAPTRTTCTTPRATPSTTSSTTARPAPCSTPTARSPCT
jgi:hypothetical protein